MSKAIGIDLGTTNSLAAIHEGEGKTRILQTVSGETFTPSVVSFNKGSMLVGRQAWDNAVTSPKDTVFSIKRLMGRSFDNPEVKNLRQKSPFSIVELPNSQVGVVIDGNEHKPEDISTMILRQVVEDARKDLGGEEVTHAVVTVPAYFSEVQRHATRIAGEQAGLIVKKIVDEPTAAAVAFGVDSPEDYPNLLVFDMGGGTLDISILYVGDRELIGDAIKGDMWLGGDNFDLKLVEIMIDWIKESYGIDPSEDKEFLMVAKRKAIDTKLKLSRHPRATVILPGVVPLSDGGKGNVNFTISRQEFEDKIKPDVDKCMDLVRKVLKENSLEPGDITKVLLVGGATFTPLVRRELALIFGEEKICHDVNPMQAVALGSAILAAQLKGIECPKDTCRALNPYENAKCTVCGGSLSSGESVGYKLFEETERNFGIRVIDDKDEADLFSVIIPARTPYPLKDPKKERYMTTSRKVKVPVYVGDSKKASENEYLGLVEYDLPQDAPPNTEVDIVFNYDRNRILTVGIEVVGRPDLNHYTTPKRYMPTTDQGDDDDEKLLSKLRYIINSVEDMTDKYGEFFEDKHKEQIVNDMDKARRALQKKELNTAKETLQSLLQVREDYDIVSILHLSDQLQLEVEPKVAKFLAAQSKKLRDAYREPRDINKVNSIRRVLESEIVNIVENFNVNIDIKAYGGILKQIGSSSGE